MFFTNYELIYKKSYENQNSESNIPSCNNEEKIENTLKTESNLPTKNTESQSLNFVKNAVDYIKSDETKEKVSSLKNNIKSVASELRNNISEHSQETLTFNEKEYDFNNEHVTANSQYISNADNNITSKTTPFLIGIIILLVIIMGLLTFIIFSQNKNHKEQNNNIVFFTSESSEEITEFFSEAEIITTQEGKNTKISVETEIITTVEETLNTETTTITMSIISPNSSLKYPILIRGYEDSICPVMVQKDGKYGTYEEMIESCVNDGVTMYSPPHFVDKTKTIYTATKHDALPENWTNNLLTYDEFIETIKILATQPEPEITTTTLQKVIITPTPVNDIQGQLNCHGGIVSGYSTSYVCESEDMSTVRKSLGDKWHVTAKNKCFSYGIEWYELWDTDDGDYYGWVDASYIDFYQQPQGDIYKNNASNDMYFGIDYYATVATESTGLRLRNAPNTESDVILEMPKGSAVEVLGENSSWCYLRYTENGIIYYGYASRQYIK